MALHDVRLPEDIEVGARGGPVFKTTIIAMSSGQETRNIDWARQKMKWDVSYGISSLDDLEDLRDFFYARRGAGYGFKFKDWTDYEIELGIIGTGDATEDEFQIVKVYESSGPLPFSRKITRPVASTVKVYLDGVLQTLTTDYTLDTGGIINFVNPPGVGVVIRVTCEFDVPVRFDSDEFAITVEAFQAGSVPSLMIIELRE